MAPSSRPVVDTSMFDLGPIRVAPDSRLLETSDEAISVEPLVMRLLVALSRRAGQIVSRRELFQICWGEAAVGDDSLNRIIAILRRTLKQLSEDAVQVQTVPGTGYVLRLSVGPAGTKGINNCRSAEAALNAGRQSLRLGLPEVDHLRIEQLRQVISSEPNNAAALGMLALLCRYAAEYAGPQSSGDYVSECAFAAEQALAVDPSQSEALVARATVSPLFGRWSDAYSELETITGSKPSCAAALHEIAIVEMSTGRVQAAKRLVDGLISRDPLSASYGYKSIWQHWSVGDVAGMDHAADRASQLWPTHPAVWTARFWTLAHTGRARAASAMLHDNAARPNIPQPMFQLLHVVTNAAALGGTSEALEAIQACRTAAQKGPALAVAALLGLGLFNAVNEAFDVAYAYYARAGERPVPLRHMEGEASINDQHRRVTQPLFTPAAEQMRSDQRFADLCERIGLESYWTASGRQPDYRASTPKRTL